MLVGFGGFHARCLPRVHAEFRDLGDGSRRARSAGVFGSTSMQSEKRKRVR